jgi:hypothetical protein
MAEKNKGLGLPQQRGNFEVKGIVTNTLKESFFKETKTKTGKDFRALNFGITFDKNQTLFVNLTGMPMENVYYSKRGEKGEKPTTLPVPWKERHTFRKEGFSLIGVNCGLTKTTDEKGKELNDIKHLTPFDACKYISENLKDDMSVYIRGNIEYSHYANQAGELQHNSKLVVTQISLCKPVDFEATGFEPDAQFTQPFVFMGVRKEDPNFAVEAKVVNYATVEDTEFVVENPKLADNFRKNVKPFTALKTWGDIRTVKNTDTVEESSSDDGWGEKNAMDRVFGQYRKTFIVTGADPESMDRETYTEALVDKAIETMNANENAKKDFGEEEDWGGSGSSKIEGKKEEDSDEAW